MDVAFTRQRLAVFVDGCFWHGCPQHFIAPQSNREWWLAKIDMNQRRDADTNALLHVAGWQVLRLWEHDSGAVMADLVEAHLDQLRRTTSVAQNHP